MRTQYDRLDLVEKIPKHHLNHLKLISETLQRLGEECYIVGGSVRDLVMGKIPQEYDLTTSAHPQKVKTLFKRVIETGIQHGTVTVVLDRIGYEVTTYRSEQGYTDGRRPDGVEFGVSLTQDLERRDFTMNALALDIKTGALVDLHDGLGDISRKIIQTIGDPILRFSEDGLRPIRAIRFASVMGFTLAPETEAAFVPTKSISAKVAVERFQVELGKILKSPHPQSGLDLLLKYNYFPLFVQNPPLPNPQFRLFPLLGQLRTLETYRESYGWFFLGLVYFASPCANEQIVSNHYPLIRELKLSAQIEKETLFFWKLWIRLSILCQSTNPEFCGTSHTLPLELDRLNISEQGHYELRRSILAPIRDFVSKNPGWTEPELYDWVSVVVSVLGQEIWGTRLRTLWKESPVLILKDLAIDGQWIQKHFPEIQGREIGIALDSTLIAILRDEIANEPDSIRDFLVRRSH